jgi:hypothetical protein
MNCSILVAPDVERSPVDEAMLMALVEFPFPFSYVRELFAEDLSSAIHRAPAPHAITSLHGVTSSMGPPLFDGGAKTDLGPDGSRTIAGSLVTKHAPGARNCHFGRVLDLFV